MQFPPRMLQRCLHVLKHRGPRPLLRMADRLGSDLVQQQGVQEHLDYLRKREALMQYPVVRQQGWPIGSGMVESANKNVVEARLKGPGMHWERGNVNPMLALRNAVCNDRWREMWRAALQQHRQHQALHRSARATQRVHADCFTAHPHSSDAPSAALPSAVSQEASAPTPSSGASQPCSNLPTPRRKRRLARHRVNTSHPGSYELSRDTCLCGTPLARFKGHRPKHYCSDRCRQRAHRKRQTTISSPCSPSQRLKQEAPRMQTHERVQRSRQPFVRKDAQTCPCGTPLVRLPGHRHREYCSDRCRQRAHRERQAQRF